MAEPEVTVKHVTGAGQGIGERVGDRGTEIGAEGLPGIAELIVTGTGRDDTSPARREHRGDHREGSRRRREGSRVRVRDPRPEWPWLGDRHVSSSAMEQLIVA